MIPEIAVPIESGAAPVSVARLPSPSPGRRIGMIWRRSSPLADRIAQIAEVLNAFCGTVAAEPATARA